jgi:hypothetical protein
MNAANNPADHPIRCPHDQVAMERLQIGENFVDRCPTCGGIWLFAARGGGTASTAPTARATARP